MARSSWLRGTPLGAAGLCVLALLSACGTGRGDDPTEDPPGDEDPNDTHETLLVADKMDLLLVVDNSMSMADKQEILAPSVARLIGNLVNPRCIDASGAPLSSAQQPASPTQACPAGSQREHAPVTDLHVGVISSSLGTLGGTGCDNASLVNPDDRAHLLDRGLGGPVPTYQDRGYLDWDPQQSHAPVPGESSLEALVQRAQDLVVGVGELGCGFEMPLEAAYRFLADPAPYESLEIDPTSQGLVPVGVDQTLLDQRAAFVRPDSLVAVVLLSDENDCSMDISGPGHLVFQPEPFYRATSACAENPDDVCCTSCALPTPEGCSPDPACAANPKYTADEDAYNLRCVDQKRRYGVDFLNPTARYANALSQATIDPTRADLTVVEGAAGVENPLFTGGRPPEFVTLTTIVGVPWQDLVVDPTDPSSDLKTSSQMESDGTWAWLLGHDPQDPFMRESREPRAGTSPATHESVSSANSINGGDFVDPDGYWLQAACTFELATPLPDSPACLQGFTSPLCDGTTQHAAPAYPGGRQLAVVRALGDQGIAGSVCPPAVGEEAFDPATIAARAHAYNAPVDELEARISPLLEE